MQAARCQIGNARCQVLADVGAIVVVVDLVLDLVDERLEEHVEALLVDERALRVVEEHVGQRIHHVEEQKLLLLQTAARRHKISLFFFSQIQHEHNKFCECNANVTRYIFFNYTCFGRVEQVEKLRGVGHKLRSEQHEQVLELVGESRFTKRHEI